ncbi:MAG: hypothetical protein MK101_12410 [Phycisphaerales bacterium]|nr:hypothetical protein [Phycisphaerales bacterium]
MQKNIVSIFVLVAMMVLMVCALYVLDAHWLWSIVVVAIFAVICVCRIVYESSKASDES